MNIHKIISKLFVEVKPQYREAFELEVVRIGIFRAKVIALFLMILETLLIFITVLFEGKRAFEAPRIYYLGMYLFMILMMSAYLVIFKKLGKYKSRNYKTVSHYCYVFTVIILLWNIGISLLDQITYGQVISYFTAIIGIGLVSLIEPIALICIFTVTQSCFIILLPFFQESRSIIFGNSVNTTIAIILSCIIQIFIYRNRTYEFTNRMIIQEKNDELSHLYEKLKNTNKELEKLAKCDGLTGINNRMMFEMFLRSEWEKAVLNHMPLTLIMIDIDYFKAYNDNYGHQAGDECLKKVAKTLSDYTITSPKYTARFGGEEFAIVMYGLAKEDALSVAEKLRKSIDELEIPHELSPVAKHITISLGVHTEVPAMSTAIEQFIFKADHALYQAKNESRNKVVYL